MSNLPKANKSKNNRGLVRCLGCLTIMIVSILCLACIVLFTPPLFRMLGIFGREASEVYELSPDPIASEQLSQAFTERNIPGVRVYVIPIKGKTSQGAFIILDPSDGYSGLSPLEDSDDVFIELLQDLTLRNRDENLRISHVTVDYRDEEGNTTLAFTVNQEDVEAYADGLMSQDEFFKVVHFDLLGTIQRLGIDEFLEESQP
ncbi:MAG: hypothetical protein MUO77_01120 [Anaerolineales bacterium]|nr:hypothetical protein [Anaerolineales bacterium]